MTAEPTVTIGEFSRLCHLPVKTLRYYHDIDLLHPDGVDAYSGYRRYSTAQVERAQLIRRLRELDMPVRQVREVLLAPTDEARDTAIAEHLTRMEAELARTQAVVASLRALLAPAPQLAVEYRTFAPQPTIAISARVARPDIGPWCGESFGTLYQAALRSGVEVVDAGGATYSTEFFENDEGTCVAYVPVPAGARVEGIDSYSLPGGTFAVAVHSGSFQDFDRTYGALGSHVAEHDVALNDPIRERYVIGPDRTDDTSRFRTEVCWPIQPTERTNR